MDALYSIVVICALQCDLKSAAAAAAAVKAAWLLGPVSFTYCDQTSSGGTVCCMTSAWHRIVTSVSLCSNRSCSL